MGGLSLLTAEVVRQRVHGGNFLGVFVWVTADLHCPFPNAMGMCKRAARKLHR